MSLAEQDIISLVTPEGLEGGSRELQTPSLTSVLGKVMQQIMFSAIMGHIWDKQVIRPSVGCEGQVLLVKPDLW